MSAGKLLASFWQAAGTLLASCWRTAGRLVASPDLPNYPRRQTQIAQITYESRARLPNSLMKASPVSEITWKCKPGLLNLPSKACPNSPGYQKNKPGLLRFFDKKTSSLQDYPGTQDIWCFPTHTASRNQVSQEMRVRPAQVNLAMVQQTLVRPTAISTMFAR